MVKIVSREHVRRIRSVIRPRLYIVSLTIISVLATYLELPQGVLPLGGDTLPLFNLAQFPRYLSAWNLWVDFGSSVPLVLAGPPLTDATFFSFLGLIGLDGPTAAWLYLASFSFVGAMSTAYLFRTVFPHFRSNQQAAILAGVVFLINPSIIVDTFKSLFLGLPERAFFPLFLGLFIDGHQNKSARFAFASGLASAPLLARFPVLTGEYLIAILVSTGAYSALVTIFSSRRNRDTRFTTKYLLTTLTTILFVNAYVFIPALTNFSLYNSTLNSFGPNFALNHWSTFFNAIRLLGYWGFYAGYSPYSAVYTSNSLVILATLALPCVSFMALLVDKSKRVAVLAAASAMLLFFLKGNNEPVGQVFVAITSIHILKVFYVSSFLAPFVAVSYSLLAPTSFARFANRLSRRRRRGSGQILRASIFLALISGMLLATWPIVTGDVSTNYWQPTSHGVTVPTPYSDLRAWLSSNANLDRTMLAYNPSVYVSTNWGFQGAAQFYQLYFSNSIVTGTGTQYSTAEPFLDFIYHTNHFVSLQGSSVINLDAVTTSTWTSYQGDDVSVSTSGYAARPALVWQNQSSDSNNHEISYSLPQSEDWSTNDLLSLWVRQSLDLSALSIGIGDNSSFVGWYDLIKHVSTGTRGWVQIMLPLRTPDRSNFNLTSVNSLWAMKNASPFGVDLSFFQLGKLGYNSVAWAKLLAMADVKWIIRDDSLVDGKWQDYGILENTNAFNLVFHRGFLTLYENAFTPNGLYAATSVITISNMLDAIGSVNDTSFSIDRWAFVVNSSFPFPQFSSDSSAQVDFQNLGNHGFDVSISSASPFILILNQQFDPRWALTSREGLILDHVKVNGYANGWIIPTSGSFHFELAFNPQLYYSLAQAVSLGALTGAILIVVVPPQIFGRIISRLHGRNKGNQNVTSIETETLVRTQHPDSTTGRPDQARVPQNA